MPTDKFIIKFDAQTGQAIAALEALAKKVEQIEARLGRAGTTLAGGGSRALLPNGSLAQFSKFTKKQVEGFVNDIDDLVKKRDAALTRLTTLKQAGRSNTNEARSNLNNLISLNQQIATAQAAVESSRAKLTSTPTPMNAKAANAHIEALKAQVALEEQLNTLIPGGSAAKTGNLIRNLQAEIKNVDFNQQTEAMLKQRTALNTLVSSYAAAGQRIPRAKLAQALQVNTQLASRGFQAAARDARLLGLELDRTSLATGRFTGAFGVHARRVAEGIILYQGFEAAVTGAAQALTLIATTDRELTRLELVLGSLPKTEADKFLKDLGQVAVETNTSFNDLLSSTDLVASALSHIPAAQRPEAIVRFSELSGQAANLLGPNTNQEDVTRRLVPILRLFNGDLDAMAGFLDKATVAANRNASEFEAIITATAEAAANIRAAGVDIDFFTLLVDELFKTTNQTPTEIGNTFNTIFGRILKSPDQVQDALDAVTDGLIQVRDEAGNIKPGTDILKELAAAAESGVIPAGKLTEALSALTGPLSPGQAGFLDAVGRAIPVVIGRSSELELAFGALEDASKELVDTLAGQFGVVVQKVIQGIIAMKDEIGGFLQGLLFLANGFIDFLGVLGSGFASFAVKTVGGLLLIKAASSGLGLLMALLNGFKAAALLAAAGGLGTLGAAAGATAVTAGAAATSVGILTTETLALATAAPAATTGMTLFGVSLRGLAVAAAAALATLGPVLALIAAADVAKFVGDVNGLTAGLNQQVGGLAEGQDRAGLLDLRARLEAQQERLNTTADTSINPFEAIPAGIAQGAVEESLREVDRLIAELTLHGADATVSANMLSEGFRGNATAADEATSAMEREWAEMQRTIAAEEARRLAMEATNTAMELNTSLADERVAALDTLNQRLGEGAITQAQYSEGQRQIAETSDLASQLVAQYGDRLGQIPALEAAAQQGTENLVGELFNLILRSGDSNAAIKRTIDHLIALAQTNAAVAASLRANPLITYIGTAGVNAQGQGFIVDPKTGRKRRVSSGFVEAAQTAGPINAQIDSLMAQLSNLINTGSSQIMGSGPGGSSLPSGGGGGSSPAARAAATPPQVSVVDIGDLSAKQVAAIITMATKLRNKIPGETARSQDSVASLIKDGKFIRNIKGIDDRLLRIAIEELTDQMEEAARQKEAETRRSNVLRNMIVNTGRTSSLISQPTLAGVGGSLTAGGGLNFDPSKGNFVINVPIELKGLEPSQLQQLVYNIIAKAIRDALRL